jgi:hypothetical protein
MVNKVCVKWVVVRMAEELGAVSLLVQACDRRLAGLLIQCLSSVWDGCHGMGSRRSGRGEGV